MNNNQKPFGNIAIAMSGGGYRATAFHLGTLDFLEYVGIITDVSMISTVSGGTFTGARYALSQADGKSFAEFFQGFYQDIASTHLPSLWLEELNRESSRETSDEIKLIKAAANVYNKRLFNNTKFGKLFDAEPKMHLNEIIFNATEFDNGIVFRFQRSNGGRIGNGKISIPQEVAKKIRIADIVATSSCFPGGFEPMVFPDDYFSATEYEPEIRKKLSSSLKSKLPVALMDGGIDDNQGVQSLITANKRIDRQIKKGKSDKSEKIGLLIISDSDNIQPNTEDIFQASSYVKKDRQPKTKKRILTDITLKQLVVLIRVFRGLIYLIPFLLLAQLISEIVKPEFSQIELLFVGVPFLLSLGIAGFIGFLFNQIQGTLLTDIQEKLQKDIGVSLWEKVQNSTLHQVLNLVGIRVFSLLAIPTVFMKRIRSLVSQEVYSNYEYRDLTISNYIYDLQQDSCKKFAEHDLKDPSEQMRQLAKLSTNMETTLWFKLGEEKQQLNQVISCGQFTMCFNLLEYILKHKSDEIGHDPVVTEVWNKSKQAWELMQNDPEALIKRYKL